MTNDPYKAAGVDLASEHSFSKAAGALCRMTFNNSPYVEVFEPTGNFRGPRYYDYKEPARSQCQFDDSTDGTGTKPILTDASKARRKAGNDLLGMLLMDFTRYGRLGQIVKNDLMVRKLGEDGTDVNQAHREILEGLGEGCNRASVVLYRGETAQSGVCVSGENPDSDYSYLWTGSVHGLRHHNLDIIGDKLVAGQPVMALLDPSSACNGISLIRKGFGFRFGPRWYDDKDAQPHIQLAAESCMLYDPFLTKINGWYDGFEPIIRVAAIAHITGGGIEEKLGKDILFPRGFSAKLTKLYDPPVIFEQVRQWVEEGTGEPVTNETLYRTFACGQRALVVLENESDEDRFVTMAAQFGINAQRCGTITKEASPKITVVSAFDGETFHYYDTSKGA